MTDPFKVIVADPPWKFSDALPGKTRGAVRNYACMTTYDICRLADTTLGELSIMGQPIASNAVLFLWRVAAMPQAALDVAMAWGFKVKTEGIWLKKTADGLRWFGMGRTLRAEHEAFYVAARGNPVVQTNSVRSTFVTDLDLCGLSAKGRKHSEKPDEFYAIVEEMFPGPRLELFARKPRAGWTCIGDEMPEIERAG